MNEPSIFFLVFLFRSRTESPQLDCSVIYKLLIETEYIMAHYHSEALYQINGRLQTLNNLSDKHFEEKYFCRRRIEELQELIVAESSKYMKEYYENELQRAEKKLEKLNQIPKKQILNDNETLLDKALKKLVDNKIKNLKLILKKRRQSIFRV